MTDNRSIYSLSSIVSLGLIILTGCAESNIPLLEIEVNDGSFVAYGVIDRSAISTFEMATKDNPAIKTLVLQWVPGSIDDTANLELARMVRDMGFTTVVPEDGLVSSGGTDLFLAGVQRDIQQGACLGVHSWGDGDSLDGRDFPRDADVHQPYLDYYSDMGIPQDFYWFTLEKAPVDGMHWMLPSEIQQYMLETSDAQGETLSEMNEEICGKRDEQAWLKRSNSSGN
ncbi:MAG: hypothetical protein J7525_15925 [Roseofilum sp. SID3]|uniref:COG3904 family protein n=1 Tax=unclassified Roseofilum TaxID=2620099 RepID=UPI001B25BBEE|nr:MULTISPECIES: hypothetical protein [unclassified Roseofilum]MBP0014588.1 hypothetical protein [Roseofilum sp. SID3]